VDKFYASELLFMYFS